MNSSPDNNEQPRSYRMQEEREHYTLGEARRQIEALWKVTADLREKVGEIFQSITQVKSQNDAVLALLQTLSDGESAVCVRRGEQVRAIIEKYAEIKAQDAVRMQEIKEIRDQIDVQQQELDKLRFWVRSFQWVIGIVSVATISWTIHRVLPWLAHAVASTPGA